MLQTVSHLLWGLGQCPAHSECKQWLSHKIRAYEGCSDVSLCRSLALKVASACRLPDSLISRAEHHYSVRNAADICCCCCLLLRAAAAAAAAARVTPLANLSVGQTGPCQAFGQAPPACTALRSLAMIKTQALDIMAQGLQGDGSRSAAQGDSLWAAAAGFAGRAGSNGAHAPAELDAGPLPQQQQPSPNSSSRDNGSGSGSSDEPCPWDDYTPPGGSLSGHSDSLAKLAPPQPVDGSKPSSQHDTGQVQGNGIALPNGSHSREGSQTRMIFADQALSSGR